jgi:hypothetical protein
MRTGIVYFAFAICVIGCTQADHRVMAAHDAGTDSGERPSLDSGQEGHTTEPDASVGCFARGVHLLVGQGLADECSGCTCLSPGNVVCGGSCPPDNAGFDDGGSEDAGR